MAETRITPIELVSPFFLETGTPQMGTVTAIASDAVNGNAISLSKDILLRLENVNVGAQTITISSSPLNGRVADITAFSIPASGIVQRRFTRSGWGNAAGDLIMLAASVDILVEAYAL